MLVNRLTAPIGIACIVLTSFVVTMQHAGATTHTSLAVSQSHVVQNDQVTLSGRSAAKKVSIERSIGAGHFRSYLQVTPHAGKYRAVVRPVVGTVTQYRVTGAAAVKVTSTACTPLPQHGSTNVWFNVRATTSYIARKWGEAICSAAPGSRIALASMFIFTGSTSADGLIAHLRTVADYRHVHVDVVVERSTFTKPLYAQFARAFSFAKVYQCLHACTLSDPNGNMHLKYMTISRTTFGKSAVIESTINWSPQQFDRQNGSAIYLYNSPRLYAAYAAESSRIERRVKATAASVQTHWTSAGSGVSYAFDPAAPMSDPIVDELARLPKCGKGDYIDVVNANVTRGRFVQHMDKLRSEGCTVRVIAENRYRPAAAAYSIRHMTTHDKFVLVHVGKVNEVMTGSEDYRPDSMLLAEEQLLRVRHKPTVEAFHAWFGKEWALAVR